MMLAGLGHTLPEAQLRAVLKTRPGVGTHPINLRRLEVYGVDVAWPYPATLADVRGLIERGVPVMAFVWTGALKYWPPTNGVDYLHAVVIVGLSDTGVLLHDPKLSSGPLEVSSEDFSAAWMLADQLIAHIEPRA